MGGPDVTRGPDFVHHWYVLNHVTQHFHCAIQLKNIKTIMIMVIINGIYR